MDLYYIIVFFIFGLVFGSFFNVVGYRLPINMSIVKPPSHCTKCNHKLEWFELIPIFSYIIQGGKCRKCGEKIAIFYPIIEFITACLFSLSYIVFGLSIDTLIALVFVSTIIILIISDIIYMIIPDSILIFSGVLIFILEILKGGFLSIPDIFINMFISFFAMYLLKIIGDKLFKRESLGGGDIKLMLIFGMVLNWKISIFVIVLAAFIALPISLFSLLTKNNHELPFGPYLGISALICLFTQITITSVLEFFGIYLTM